MSSGQDYISSRVAEHIFCHTLLPQDTHILDKKQHLNALLSPQESARDLEKPYAQAKPRLSAHKAASSVVCPGEQEPFCHMWA